MKIATKLALHTLLIGMLPLLLVGWAALSQMYQLAEQHYFDRVSQSADIREQQINQLVKEQLRITSGLAASVPLSTLLSSRVARPSEQQDASSDVDEWGSKIANYFIREQPIITQDSFLSGLYLLSLQGEVLYSHHNHDLQGESLEDGFYSDSELARVWRAVASTQTVQITPYRWFEPANKMVLLIAAPVYQQQQLIGMVALQYGVDWINRLFPDDSGLGKSGDIALVTDTPEGRTLLKSSLFLDQVTEECVARYPQLSDQMPMMLALEEKQEGVGWREDARCVEVVANWRYLSSIHGGLVVKIDRDEVMADYLWVRDLLVWGLIVVVVLVLVLSLWASRRVSQRIVYLKERTLLIAKEDMQQQTIDEYGSDEIGLLAEAFRAMMKRIRDRTMALQEKNRQLLQHEEEQEQLIASRTEELYESKVYAENIITSMRDVLIVTDTAGVITMANQATQELLGYSGDELIGQPVGILFVEEKEKEKEILSVEGVGRLRDNLREIIAQDYLQYLKIFEGSPVALLDVDQSGQIRNANTEASRTFGRSSRALVGEKLEQIFPDALRNHSKTYRDLFLRSDDGVLQVASSSALDDDRERLTLQIELIEVSTPVGAGWVVVIYDEMRSEQWKLVRYTPFGQLFLHNSNRSELQLRCENGETLPAMLSGEVLRSQGKKEDLGVVLVLRDLRERKALEMKTNEAAYQGGLGEMSATILHNIGNVVTGLNGEVYDLRTALGDLDVLSRGLDALYQQSLDHSDQQQQQKVTKALGKASEIIRQLVEERMAKDLDDIDEIVQHIVDIISLQQGVVKGGFWATEFDLHKTLNEGLAMQAADLRRAQIECDLELDSSISQVRLPRGPLMQMFVNLLKNAREAILSCSTRDQSLIKIVLQSIEGKEGGAEWFQLIIEDSGGGIPPEKLSQVFESGYSTKSTGSGLGLHSVATFVQSVGGTITVENIETTNGDQGARFTVTLPIWFKG